MGNKFGAFLAGGLAGAAVALLCAPRSGRETRTMVADKVNDAWGEAQNLNADGGVNVQQAYQTAVARGQEVAQAAQAQAAEFAQVAQAKGQEVYDQASERVRAAAAGAGIQFAGGQDDELREKIEAARQRIAAQVAKNAEESGIAADAVIPVAGAETEAPAPAAEPAAPVVLAAPAEPATAASAEPEPASAPGAPAHAPAPAPVTPAVDTVFGKHAAE